MSEILNKIKKASEKQLVITFVGVGSAFAKKNDQSSIIIAKGGKTILVDVGTTIPQSLYRQGIKITDFDYYHVTHAHADHAGGLEELLLMSRYVSKRKSRFIITFPFADILWEKTLKGGCEINEDGRLKFSDFVDFINPTWMAAQPREKYEVIVDDIKLEIFRTIHVPGGVEEWGKAFWTTGLIIDDTVMFSGDTRFDTNIFKDFPIENYKCIFHDCQLFSPGTVHATYDELKFLPDKIKNEMYLYHYGDNFEAFTPEKDGFKGFAKPWELYKF